MLYIVIFLILSSSVCIYSKKDWENFVDRLDLLITDSYLIIQCNENEIQIISFVTTFEELESNLKCTNKNNLLEHGSERMQIIDFNKVVINCQNSKFIRIEANFNQIKQSLEKKGNEVDWPYIHTPFTKETGKTDPIKMKFFKNKNIELTLYQIVVKELSNVKENFFIYLDFVNRPMVCRIRIDGLQKKTNSGSCNKDILDNVYEPTCYYKVGEESSPSHEEFDQIIDKIVPYVKSLKSNYTYISDVKNAIDLHNNNNNKEKKKGDKSETILSSNNDKKKLSPLIFVIIIIFGICLIIIIGFILFHKNNSSEKDNLSSEKSDSSNESEISIPSNTSDSIKSEKDSALKQTSKRGGTSWYKLDEDI